MIMKLRTGKLEKALRQKRKTQIPFSETIQHVVVTKLQGGDIAEDEEYIQAEKDKKLETLKSKYGEIDAAEITWVMVKKS
ncbi:MAG: hypothetical protein GY868_14750 [Deltaproteobacteria bacterium]|nr:hypothetical protein [Deltaproteobacteria bacterium]